MRAHEAGTDVVLAYHWICRWREPCRIPSQFCRTNLKIDIAHVVRTFCFTGVDAGACLARAAIGHAVLHACGLPARLILLTDTDASSLSVQFVLTVPGAKRFPSLLLTECRLPRDRRSVHTRSHE
jgi:hypothetical protein